MASREGVRRHSSSEEQANQRGILANGLGIGQQLHRYAYESVRLHEGSLVFRIFFLCFLFEYVSQFIEMAETRFSIAGDVSAILAPQQVCIRWYRGGNTRGQDLCSFRELFHTFISNKTVLTLF